MKNKTRILGVLFLFMAANAVAQSEKEVYKFSIHIEKAMEKDTVPSMKYQMGAFEYSFVGNYKKTQETWDKFTGFRKPTITKEDSLYFIGFMPVCARDYIVERSKDEQIIIINEAHTNPNHRTFTSSLLQGLYDNGYRYLGLEALFDRGDTLINERKYPIIESGYYTKEPEFGNFIYTALQIGFTLFGYDYDWERGGKEREIAQARNIVNYIENNPPAKVLIHCGHDHVTEGTPNIASWEKAMAGRLKEYTQIDPFTIDQTRYAESSDKEYNHSYIAVVNKDFPVVLINENGNLFNMVGRNSDKVDCIIIHPETQYVNNRPHWVLSEDGRKGYHIEKSKIVQYPLLVLAYRKNEFDNNGIPTDVIEIVDNEIIPSLILGEGDYEIIIKDRDYNIIDRYDVKMK